jgi:hypothetical protein
VSGRAVWEYSDQDGIDDAYMSLTDAEHVLDLQLPDNHDWTVPLLNPNYKAGGDE